MVPQVKGHHKVNVILLKREMMQMEHARCATWLYLMYMSCGSSIY